MYLVISGPSGYQQCSKLCWQNEPHLVKNALVKGLRTPPNIHTTTPYHNLLLGLDLSLGFLFHPHPKVRSGDSSESTSPCCHNSEWSEGFLMRTSMWPKGLVSDPVVGDVDKCLEVATAWMKGSHWEQAIQLLSGRTTDPCCMHETAIASINASDTVVIAPYLTNLCIYMCMYIYNIVNHQSIISIFKVLKFFEYQTTCSNVQTFKSSQTCWTATSHWGIPVMLWVFVHRTDVVLYNTVIAACAMAGFSKPPFGGWLHFECVNVIVFRKWYPHMSLLLHWKPSCCCWSLKPLLVEAGTWRRIVFFFDEKGGWFVDIQLDYWCEGPPKAQTLRMADAHTEWDFPPPCIPG